MDPAAPTVKILAATCIRNGARHIWRLRLVIAALEKLSPQWRLVVVESDSDDSTVEELRKLQPSSNIEIVSLGRLSDRIPLRTERLAHCRNEYLKKIPDYFNTGDPGLVIVFDSDNCLSRKFLTNLHAQVNGALRRANEKPWVGITGITLPLYYDIWALRAGFWNTGDCWRDYTALVLTGVDRTLAKRIAINSKQVYLGDIRCHIQVESAFNGFAIYRAECLAGARYAGVDGLGDEVCEHVAFHRNLRDLNTRLGMWIDTELVVGQTPVDHLTGHGMREQLERAIVVATMRLAR